MKRKSIGALMLSILSISMFASNNALTPEQTQAVKTIIAETLTEQPKLVINAIMAFRKEQINEYQKSSEKMISKYSNEIFKENTDLVLGNPKGTTTIVEFIDYNCGHCKKLATTLKGIYEKNSNIKVIVKDLPIFGDSSQIAAKAAYAAYKQNKYAPYHYALIARTKKADQDSTQKIAQELGLDLTAFNKDYNSKSAQTYIDKNMKLAKKMNIMATPAMIIQKNGKNVFVAGALPQPEITKIIENL